MNGQSPAEKVLGGDNPNDVFNAQEEFKDRNKLNDDGSRKFRAGGLSRAKDYGSSKNLILKLKAEILLEVAEVILFLQKLMLLTLCDWPGFMVGQMLKVKFIVNILNFVKIKRNGRRES